NDSPFFIVGSGRSGTTLLRLILCGHSRLHIPPETWYILYMVKELPVAGLLTPTQIERAITLMVDSYRWPDMSMTPHELRQEVQRLPRPRLVDIINIVYHRHLRASGKQRFGDNTPIYFKIVSQLIDLYPDAKFIHLIRDGRDVAISWIDLNYDR